MYYAFIDSLVVKYDPLSPYHLDEYLLVHRNDWIIDSLEETDYYRRMDKNEFIYDFKALDIIYENDTIYISLEEYAEVFRKKQKNILIDVNIPEFKLRIKEKDSILYTFPIRVGRNEKKYLAMAGPCGFKNQTRKG
ncbi:MAG: hypothetical protein ACI94Y_002751 [Maribacter sp.]